MKQLIIISFLFLLLLADAKRTILRLFPEGHDIVYSYRAAVTTGSIPPTSFVSQFNLQGKVVVQSQADHAVVQFLDLKYSMFSGDDHNQHDSKMIPLPSEAAGLHNPFVLYYTAGKVSKMLVDKEEAAWSTSVKQALAGVLQLDITKMFSNKSQSFKSKEDSIHGQCLTLYSVERQDGGFRVTKFNNKMDCDSASVSWSNVEGVDGSNPHLFQYDVMSTSQKTYNVTEYKGSNSLLIEGVRSEGVSYAVPREYSSKAHAITVSQFLEFKEINNISEPNEAMNLQEISSLKYDASEFYSFKFSTDEDLSKVVEKALKLIYVIATELQRSDFQLFESYNSQNSHLIPLLITYLRKLDVELLQSVFDEIRRRNSSCASDVFVKMLPLVGSEDSAVFMVNLIKSKRVQDHVALYVLASLPFNMRQTSESMLRKLEVMINMPEDVEHLVRSSSILSFATLIHRTCKFSGCSNETTHKYAMKYLQYVRDHMDNYEKQQLYIAGIQNMQSEQVYNFLISLIFWDENSVIVRLSAMRAVLPLISNNPDKVSAVFWPILSNRSNSLELRANALILVLKTELPLTSYLQLHWLMADEPCQHLYNLYFSLTKTFAESKSDFFAFRNKAARRVFVMTYKPNLSVSTTSHFKIDVSSKEFIEVTTIANLQTGFVESAFISLTSLEIGNILSVYIKIQGIKENYFKLFKEAVFFENKNVPILDGPLHIELIVYFHNQAVLVQSYNENNTNILIKDVKRLLSLLSEAQISFYHVSSSFNLEKFFVTDLGMPGVLSVDNPTLSAICNDPLENTFNARYWSQGSTVFKVKNTIANIWQGIITTHVSRFNFPLQIKFNFNNPLDLQIELSKPLSGNGFLGFEWHINTDIFTVTYHDKYDALLESCQKCKSLVSVSNKNNIKKVLNEQRANDFSVITVASNCEDDGSINYAKSIQDIYNKYNLFFLGVLASGGYFLKNSLSELPISGSCSYSTSFTPKYSNHATKFCLNVKDYSSKTEDSYDWRNKTKTISLELTYPSFLRSEIKECCFKSISASIVVNECLGKEHLNVDQGVCIRDQCKQPGETPQTKRLLKFSAVVLQVIDQVEEIILDLMNSVTEHFRQHMSIGVEPTTPQRKVETELVLDCKENTYSLDVATASRRIIIKHVPFDRYSYFFMLLNDIVH